MPKEMLPIVDKPVIQIVVENLVKAGITDIIIVTGYHKRAIEDHFDSPSRELVENLKMAGDKKKHLLEETEKISELANFYYVRQKGPYGNGTPLLNVAEIVGDEPFIYTWSDDYISAERNEFQQMLDVYDRYQCNVLACIRARDDSEYDRFGFAAGKTLEEGMIDVDELIEKPGKDLAPSDLATVSAFLFEPKIFTYLDKAMKNLKTNQELYWSDALIMMMNDGARVIAKEIEGGVYYDTGNKMGYLKAVVDAALQDQKFGDEFREYLKKVTS